MSKYPFISIIIPLYNVEEYITDCLNSVARQTYQARLECIIVDDSGVDKSVDIVEKFLSSYKGHIEFQLVHHNCNRGLSAARNTGVSVANGEYIYFLDSDDYISDDCLEQLTLPLQNYDYDMVLGNLKTFGNPRKTCFLPKEEEALFDDDIFRYFYVDRQIYVMACNKLTKASLFHQYDMDFLERQLHEDELWTYKSVIALKSLYVSKNVTYYYRIHEGSISSDHKKNTKKRYTSCLNTIDYVLSHKTNISKDFMDKCILYYFSVYLRNIMFENFDYYKDYVNLRKRFDYHPIRLLIQGKLSIMDVKHQFHFVLSPTLGYIYLKIRFFKQNLLNKNR